MRWLAVAGVLVVALFAVLWWESRDAASPSPRASGTRANPSQAGERTADAGAVAPVLAADPVAVGMPVDLGEAGSGSDAHVRAPAAVPWPAPPKSYVLSDSGGGHPAIALAGGASTVASVTELAPPKAGRTIRGRVIGADGPVPVLAGGNLHVWFGSLGGERGAMSAADGTFEIAGVGTDAVHVLAVTPQAWSEIADVPAGPDDARVDLHLGAMTGVEGTITYAGRVEPIEILLVRGRDVTFEALTEAGKYRMAPLPPGTFELRVGLAREIGGGASARQTRTLTLAPGTVTRADFDLSPGVALVVTAELPDPKLQPQMVHYTLHDGAAPAPATPAEAKKTALDGMLYGGRDALTPMTFHDRAPGSYVVCVDAVADKVTYFGCAPVTLAPTPAEQKLVLPIARVK